MNKSYSTLVLVVVLACSSQLHARSSFYSLEKARNFLKKKNACDYAVGALKKGSNSEVYNEVYCIADMTFNKGSIEETSVCAFSKFDMSSGRYSYTGTRYLGGDSYVDTPVFSSKKCHKGGFQELLTKPARQGYIYDDGRTVKQWLTHTEPTKTIFLYTSDQKLKEYVKIENAKVTRAKKKKPQKRTELDKTNKDKSCRKTKEFQAMCSLCKKGDNGFPCGKIVWDSYDGAGKEGKLRTAIEGMLKTCGLPELAEDDNSYFGNIEGICYRGESIARQTDHRDDNPPSSKKTAQKNKLMKRFPANVNDYNKCASFCHEQRNSKGGISYIDCLSLCGEAF